MLSKEYADLRRKEFNAGVAIPAQPDSGDPWEFSEIDRPNHFPESARLDISETEDNIHPDGTTHISVIDGSGNFACATPSGGSFSKSVFFPELGCALSTRIEMFNLIEGHPNQVAPSKRPRTTLVNYIVAKDGKPLITKEHYKKMKPTSYIINAARGNIVDEKDLNDALNENLIAGAAVDVFSKEPAKENILFNNPKVILTPHIAASTTEASIVVAEMIANQISNFLLKGVKVNTV